MIAYAQLYISIGIVLLIFLIFASFTLVAANWVRMYFNKHEPVYVLEDARLVKNHIASRFCKIVITNVIKDQCMRNVENIGLWMLIHKARHPTPNRIDSIQNLHYCMLNIIRAEVTEEQYYSAMEYLEDINHNLIQHLTKSEISTPPYLTMNTYLLWVGDGLDSFSE